jgi:hypothetical protein
MSIITLTPDQQAVANENSAPAVTPNAAPADSGEGFPRPEGFPPLEYSKPHEYSNAPYKHAVTKHAVTKSGD